MTKYPSLYAALEPTTAPDGKRGATVRCTATRRDLGFIWWEVITGTQVAWHWRTGEHFGERTTERNAVQALRDVSNAAGQTRLPYTDAEPVRPATKRHAPSAPSVAPAVAPMATPATTTSRVTDLTAAIAAAFTRHQGAK